MPKPLATKDKFIYDPEHGGGRKRRNKQMPGRRFRDQEEEMVDSYGPSTFNQRLQTPDQSPFKKVQPKQCQKEFIDDSDPFEIAKDASPDSRYIQRIDRQEDVQMITPDKSNKKMTISNQATGG